MTFRNLMTLLSNEHQRHYGTAPTGTRWLWKPWVREFLRTYEPPKPQLEVARKGTQ